MGDAGVWVARPVLADSLHAGHLVLRQMTLGTQRRGRLRVPFIRDVLSVVLPDATVGFLEKLLIPMELVLEQRLAIGAYLIHLAMDATTPKSLPMLGGQK